MLRINRSKAPIYGRDTKCPYNPLKLPADAGEQEVLRTNSA